MLHISSKCILGCGLALAVVIPLGSAHAKGFGVLYSFAGGSDGANPQLSLSPMERAISTARRLKAAAAIAPPMAIPAAAPSSSSHRTALKPYSIPSPAGVMAPVLPPA